MCLSCLGRLLFALGAGLWLVSGATTTLAGPVPVDSLNILASSVIADPTLRQVDFTVTFDHPPQLFAIDPASDQPVDSFQYFYDSAAMDTGISFGPDVSVIRGTEIRFNHDDAIPIRYSDNPSGEDFPHAEGFGAIRGIAPFTLDGSTVRFRVPWHVLGETDGQFSYHLIALQRGVETSEVSSVAIPLPPGVWAGLTVLPVAWWVARRWTHSRRDRGGHWKRRLL